MRLYKSVKMAKGVKLNLSKSGIGISAGTKGARFSTGPRGTRINSLQVSSGKNNHHSSKAVNSSNGNLNSKQEFDVEVKVSIDEDSGKETLSFYRDGKELLDDYIIRKVKRDEHFKERLQLLREELHEKLNQKSKGILEIHQLSPKIVDWNQIIHEYNTSTPKVYKKRTFSVPKPETTDVYKNLEVIAKKKIRGLFGISKKRKQYVDENFENFFQNTLKQWELEKETFQKEEQQREIQENENNKNDYLKWKQKMECVIHPSEQELKELLESSFSNLELPLEFSFRFDLDLLTNAVTIEALIPTIEDLPKKKSSLLSSGKVSIKDKTQKEIQQEYYVFCLGQSLLFASKAFNASPVIEFVVVSGCINGIDKVTGNSEKQCLYTVKYNKDQFSKMNVINVEPEAAFKSFEHRLNVTKSNLMKPLSSFS